MADLEEQKETDKPGPARSTIREWVGAFGYGAGKLLLDLLALDPLAELPDTTPPDHLKRIPGFPVICVYKRILLQYRMKCRAIRVTCGGSLYCRGVQTKYVAFSTSFNPGLYGGCFRVCRRLYLWPRLVNL